MIDHTFGVTKQNLQELNSYDINAYYNTFVPC